MFKKLQKELRKFFKKIKAEFFENKLLYVFLTTILVSAFFVRTHRLDQLIGFYYDQGRDAQIIWDLWYDGKLFLIGPVTGLAGIFLGPFYYYMIAPFYILGGGDPVWPAVFLAFLSTAAILITYYLGWKMESRTTGIIAALITSFSYYLVLAGRWLSNPTPILLSSVILFWALWELANNKDKRWWIVVSLMVGISLHFEAASAVFYIPLVVVFLVWQLTNNNRPSTLKVKARSKISSNSDTFFHRLKHEFGSFKILNISLLVFFITLIPQLLFNFRHDNILLNNFIRLFTEEESFSPNINVVLDDRMNYFWGVFHSKILVGKPHYTAIFTMFSFSGIVYFWRELYKKKVLQLFGIFLIVPAIGFILFQGNHGNIYDYYLTGYYNIFVLFFALGFGLLWRHNFGKLVVISFMVIFFQINIPLIRNYVSAGADGPTHITLGNEMQAINWILSDVDYGQEFNTDFYVPPVIPHTYNYLMSWQSTKKCGENMCGWVRDEVRELVYVLYEQDPPHPERLEVWLSGREENTEILEEARFGGITVQRRIRL